MSTREYAREVIRRVRPDLRIRAGSPLESFLLDPLAALLPSLDQKLSQRYESTLDDKAALFLISRDAGELCEFVVRLYFTSACELNYGVGQMTFPGPSGVIYSNKYSVSVPSAQMALYIDDVYFYSDITLTGDGLFTLSDSLEWDDPLASYSFLTIMSITSGGHAAEDDAALETRLDECIALRNLVTNPGTSAWLYDQYGATIRESLAIGMGETEMLRDMVGLNHIGGYVDLYVKPDLPTERTLLFDVMPVLDQVFEETVTVLFEAATEELVFTNLTTDIVGATSPAFPGKAITEGAANDFTVDRTLGTVTLTGGTTILPTADWDTTTGGVGVWTGGGMPLPRKLEHATNQFGVNELAVDMIVKLTNTAGVVTSEYYLVVSIDPGNGRFYLDRDLHNGADTYVVNRYEPIEFTFDYNPTGVDLTSLERPVMWVNDITLIDPLTDEPFDPITTIPRLGGYGTGIYGGGPYGLGTTEGWRIRTVDSNYRYSCEETGVIEIVGATYLGARAQINYLTASQIPTIQDAVDINRPQSGDVLVKAFIPVGVTIDVDVTSTLTSITGLESYIWEMSNRMELSDIIEELYTLGATFVDIDDIITGSTFEKWKIDGDFEVLTATSAGVLDIADQTSRFLPVSITIRPTP